MKNLIAITLIVAGAALTIGFSQLSARRSAASNAGTVERGRYLVTIMGCNDCHTAVKGGAKGPEADLARFLSGQPEEMGALPATTAPGPGVGAGAATNTAFSGPWGVSYAANITPDQNTGLGIWTEDM